MKIIRKLIIAGIVMLIITITSIFCFNYFLPKGEVKDNSQLTIDKDLAAYINNIRITELSILEGHMNIGSEDRKGFNFVMGYTLPAEENISSDKNIGFQVEYPEEYFNAIGSNMSAITYIPTMKPREQVSYFAYGAYPSDITTGDLGKLLNTQYTFKINIVVDRQVVRELYIQNSLANLNGSIELE